MRKHAFRIRLNPAFLTMSRDVCPHLFVPKVWIIMYSICFSGAGCLKLTTSLVNVSLKFKTFKLQIHCYFCWKNLRIFCTAKDSHIFSTKNNSGFDNIVSIYLTN